MSEINQEILKRVLRESIIGWNSNFGGVSALDISDKIELDNEVVMKAMEGLSEAGMGTMNRDVELGAITFDTENPKFELPIKRVKTHIFFPSPDVLRRHYYESREAEREHSEFIKRLMWGGSQLELVYFNEEVLARYFSHPDWYEIEDSRSGGHIMSTGEAPDDRYLYIRHGRMLSEDGTSFISVILKDLYVIPESEQRHWHAHEISNPNLAQLDENGYKFLARTYEGSWVNYSNPIAEVSHAISSLNNVFGSDPLFGRIENQHLRPPVENTIKAFNDRCSELYKLVGPDSLKSKSMKKWLSLYCGKSEADFLHESGRPLSPLQLLEVLEENIQSDSQLTQNIREIGKYRTDADHKVIVDATANTNLVAVFNDLCQSLVKAINGFKSTLSSK